MASNGSVQELTAELQTVREQLILFTAEKYELSMRLSTVLAESDRRLVALAVVHSARYSVEGLVQSVFDQSVWTLGTSINKVGVQRVDRFRTVSEDDYAGSQLPFSNKLRHVSGVFAANDEVQCLVSPSEEGWGYDGTKPSAPDPPNPSDPPSKWSRGRSKRICRYCFVCRLTFFASRLLITKVNRLPPPILSSFFFEFSSVSLQVLADRIWAFVCSFQIFHEIMVRFREMSLRSLTAYWRTEEKDKGGCVRMAEECFWGGGLL